jgi:hypothetical protein
MREEVVLAKTDQRDGLTRVMVEYVITKINLDNVTARCLATTRYNVVSNENSNSTTLLSPWSHDMAMHALIS